MLASSAASWLVSSLATACWINRALRLPRSLEGLKPVLILPVLGTLLVGLLMMYVIGTPVAGLLAWLTDWLRGMQGGSAILLGLLLGGMMAVDMGGPVNKASYAFSTALISSQVYTPMAATMIGGMTPPLGIALATWLFSNRFTAEARHGRCCRRAWPQFRDRRRDPLRRA